jgi:TPR repeat protein
MLKGDAEGGTERGLALVKSAAEAGIADAQFAMGLLLQNGEHLQKDYAAAAGWYERGAMNGSNPARANLGRLYERGWGVTRDVQKAFDLAKVAAEHGVVEAEGNLAIYYDRGIGTAVDHDAATLWRNRAARDQNSAVSIRLEQTVASD